MKHIASCSFGADSTATVLLAIENDEPLDELAYCEVMFDRETSGEVPEHRDFIYEKAIPYFETHGIKTKVLRADWTYIDHFTAVITRGERKGKIRGFPLCGMCTICRDCKLPPIRKYIKELPSETVQYIGIADDEQERLFRLDANKISLLSKYHVTQTAARELDKRHGLLSPIYEFAPRNGCFFCPNAKEPELRHLYDHHRDLWDRLLELQALPNKVSELFNRTMRFSDWNDKFYWDDRQISFFDL
jgi:3'-phosphoadenosine 5'-phosphosulfate sulfotransferase (PAPS reductase)/FAD synthetase